jgi:glutamate racemase
MIGVFDSGLGGLTVLKYFIKEMGEYDYIYLGDNARSPYGGRSQDVIYKYTEEAVDYLFKKGCHFIIIACNSASSQALRKIQQEYLPKKFPDKRVLGVIRPLVEKTAENKNIKKAGVLATKATIESGAYDKELKKLNPDLEIIGRSAPLLVPLVEEGWADKKETKTILKNYLRPLKQKQIQALILGCTHYPFLFKNIKKIMGKRCQVEDPGKIIAISLRDYLARHPEIDAQLEKNGLLKFYTTGAVENFKKTGEKFLESDINNIEKISL